MFHAFFLSSPQTTFEQLLFFFMAAEGIALQITYNLDVKFPSNWGIHQRSILFHCSIITIVTKITNQTFWGNIWYFFFSFTNDV